jgi:DNA-binding response OmpR family regulator
MMETCPRVMVLDSEVDALPPLYRLLSDRGCRVATYSSPWAACQYAAAEKPDAIFTSIGFPGCEGLDIVRLLREASPQSRIIVFASADQWPGIGDAADAGADTLLSKPAKDEEVLRRLHGVFEGDFVAATS